MSYVEMERNICPVCGITHRHNTGILLNTMLKDIKPENTVTGYGLCEKDEKLKENGYIALIGVSNGGTKDILKFQEAERTGDLLHIRKEALASIIDSKSIPDDLDFMFISDEALQEIKNEYGNTEDPLPH